MLCGPFWLVLYSLFSPQGEGFLYQEESTHSLFYLSKLSPVTSIMLA